MPLDFSRLVGQVDVLAQRARDDQADFQQRLASALQALHVQSSEAATLRDRIEGNRGRYTWLVAGIHEPLNAAYDAPTLPADHAVVATDGSQIDVDRNAPAPWFLLNMGRVFLRYGDAPEARLDSIPQVFGRDDELVLVNPQNRVQQEMIEGTLLGYKRAVEEVKALAEVVRQTPEGLPTLALLDGSLVLWGLGSQSYGEYVREALLVTGLRPALDALYVEAQKRPLAVASYISLPRSTEVVNTLRIALCPYETPDCDRHCRTIRPLERPCDPVARVLDRNLFQHLLEPGQRSGLFSSPSQIVTDRYYGPHKVLAFYLHTGSEVARVEMPEWVGQEGRLELLHAALTQQVQLGQGYPLALTEAHEQAVVRAADREVFWQMVESQLTDQQMRPRTPEKARSKSRRWL